MIQTQRLQQAVQKIVMAVSHIGAHPDDSDTVRLQKAIQNNAVLFGGIPAGLVNGTLFFVYAEYQGSAIVFAFTALSLFGLIGLGLTRRYYPFFKFLQFAVPLLSPFSATLASGGIVNTGFSMIWGLVAPLFAFIVYPARIAFYWLGAFLMTIAIAGLAQPYLRATNNFPFSIITTLAVINIIGASIMSVGALYYFVNQRDIAHRLLNIERDKAENLLLNILPPEIASILKNSTGVIADHYDGASILFAYIVNFTPMSGKMTPTELVELLNEVFSCFETLVEKYGLEKIKTIGDCYMVAAGVPRPRPDHAHILTRLALDIRDYVDQHEFLGKRLALRIGLNSGPVVAGVIGHKKFSYDLWGDAVNTASRMESHGTGGCIQIAAATYELIKDDFICEPRGVVSVKGKGEINVWYVLENKT